MAQSGLLWLSTEVVAHRISKAQPSCYWSLLLDKVKTHLSFDCKFADGVEEVFPLLFLGPQTLLMLVEPAAQSSGLLGSQIQGLVLLTLKERTLTFSGAENIFGPNAKRQ